jgi:hypothetical protein
MGSQNRSSRLVSIIGPPAILLISAYLMLMLPKEIQLVLTVWTLTSFPIGVLFGHCAFSEGSTRSP